MGIAGLIGFIMGDRRTYLIPIRKELDETKSEVGRIREAVKLLREKYPELEKSFQSLGLM